MFATFLSKLYIIIIIINITINVLLIIITNINKNLFFLLCGKKSFVMSNLLLLLGQLFDIGFIYL